jgi:carbon starvation protein CstA
MQEDETKMHDDLEKITTSITNLADKEIGKVAKDYFFMAILCLVMLIAIAIMMIVIITGKRRE